MEVRQAHLGGPGETSGHSENREPAIIIKTNTTNGTSWLGGALSLAHLIRGTSIISSSNPHELTVQGEREAAPAGVHRVQAVCWPRGPAAPPKGCSLTKAIVRSFLSCQLPPPSSFGSHSGPGTTPRRRRNLGKEAAATKRARRAPRCLPAFPAHRCPPFPHSLAPGGLPRRRQPSTCKGKAPGLPPSPRAGELPSLPGGKGPPRGRGEGPPGSGTGQGAGHWKGKARDREGLT